MTHTEGDFTGNLDVAVRSSSKLAAKTIVENLRLKVPGYDELLSASGYGDTEEQLELTFGLADLASSLGVDDFIGWQRKTAMNLKTVELWWWPSGGSKLATVSCTRATEN